MRFTIDINLFQNNFGRLENCRTHATDYVHNLKSIGLIVIGLSVSRVGSGFYAVTFVRLFPRTLFNIAAFQRLLGFCSWLFLPVHRFTTYNPTRNNQTRLRRRVLMYFNKIGFCAVRALFSLKQKHTGKQTGKGNVYAVYAFTSRTSLIIIIY